MTRDDRLDNLVDPEFKLKTYGIVFIAFMLYFLMPFGAHAGGLILAPLVAIGAVGGILSIPSFRSLTVSQIPFWVWGLMGFLLWAFISSFWSPYTDPQIVKNPMKLLIGVPLYLLCLVGICRAFDVRRVLFSHLLMASSFMGAGLLMIDAISGYGLFYLFDPPKPGQNGFTWQGKARANLNQGIVVASLVMGPVAVIMIKWFRYGWVMAGALVLMTFLGALICGLSIALMAIILSLIFMFIGYIRPRFCLSILTMGGMASILFAPILGLLARHFSDEVKASLPGSFEHRIEMWSYVGGRVFERPIFGHGFDAARTFDDTFTFRDFGEWDIVTLHPHNAGLHIWLETGAIGAVLGALFVYFLGMSASNKFKDNPPQMAAISGFFTTALLVCNVSYGVWQEWLWAALILTSAIVILVPKHHVSKI